MIQDSGTKDFSLLQCIVEIGVNLGGGRKGDESPQNLKWGH